MANTYPETEQMKVLVTGASGFIGRLICPHLLANGYSLRAFDRSRSEIFPDAYEGRLEDLPGLRRAAAGVDTIIHLAACSDDADFVTRLVPANVVGLFHAFEAARLEGVRRFILASSCQVADFVGRRQLITGEDRFPTNNYSLTKLWAEDMGRMYSWRYGLTVLAVRIGWVVRSYSELSEVISTPGGKQLYLSHDDLRNFFLCCLKAKLKSFSVTYAVSRQTRENIFDLHYAKELLGYDPSDEFPNGLDKHMFQDD